MAATRLSLESLFPSFEDDEQIIQSTDPEIQEIQASPVEDDAAFAADASQALSEATEEGAVVQSSLEALSLSIKMTGRLLRKHKGFEDDAVAAAGLDPETVDAAAATDPVEAVVADTNTETVQTSDAEGNTVDVIPDPKDLATEVAMEAMDPKKFFGNIWQGIIAALKKIGQGIMNFIRQVQIWVSGVATKGEEKFYESVKGQIPNLISEKGGATMTLSPKLDKSFGDGFTYLSNKMAELLKNTTANVAALEKLVANLGTEEKADLLDAARNGIEDTDTAIGNFKQACGAPADTVTPANWMAFYVYGVKDAGALKPTEKAIKDVFGADSFAELAPGKANAVKPLIAAIQKTQGEVSKATGTAEKAAKKAVAASAALKTTMQVAAKNMSSTRASCSLLVSCALGGFGTYLKHRGQLVAALKKMGAKGAPAADKGEKK